jgi:asparagine synthase (glutamine-hydrolysing)
MDGPVALAHRLCHTTPESLTEVQPVVNQAAGLSLVADARVDNREELIALLALPGLAKHSDADLIAAAYLRWGSECVQRILGDFAFVAWNARDRTLFCARDPMGVKPFYYVRTTQFFGFASELKALLALPHVEAVVDEEQVALFLGWFHEDRSRTIFRNVMRLPAAHTMSISREHSRVGCYWNPEAAPDVRFGSDAEYAEAFRDRFATAVRARLRSVRPVGTTLSGGLDSSSILCMARRLGGPGAAPLHAFSLVFPGLPEKELRHIDECSFMDAALREGGVQHHLVRGDTLSPMRDAVRVLSHLDEPYSTPNLYLHWGLFETANAKGVRVLLDGFDGDSVVSHGFGRLTALARAGEWDTLEAEVGAFTASHGKSTDFALQNFVLPHLTELAKRGKLVSWLRAADELTRRFRVSRRELALGFGLLPLLPESVRSLARSFERDTHSTDAILRTPVKRVLRRHKRAAARVASRSRAVSERETHVQGLSQPLYQLTLEIADKSAAAFGVEPRYPFFDRRLIEFCLGLPDEQKFAGGWPRLLLRRAMEGILPREIQWRTTKANLGPNFHRRFKSADIAEMDLAGHDALSEYMHADRLKKLTRKYLASPNDSTFDGVATLLFRAAVLETWLDRFSHADHRALPPALSPAAA